VVVADDSLLLREGVVRLLTSRGMEVVGQAGTYEELLAEVDRKDPDVAVVDIRMPPTGTDEGLRAASELAKSHPALAVLVLSDFLEVRYATRLLDAGTPGRGYLMKQTVTNLDEFVESVRRVAAGESVIDRAIVSQVLGRLRERNPLAELTDRELEILNLMAQGRSNAAITEHFQVSPRTVETHIGSLFLKLGLEEARDDHRRVLAVLAFLNTR
jgi:DNA-binding NarL/FixJ family response regulator